MRFSSRPLPNEFFVRPPDQVAPDLIGKSLVRRLGRREIRARVVETEAYLGADDPAAHTAAGLTKRTRILFGPPGRAYVYLIYGMYFCLNVSTLPDGQAGGVLFRALESLGEEPPLNLSGPGCLTRALKIDLRLNGHDLTQAGPLYLADGSMPQRIAVTRRIGISQGRDLPHRYVDPDSAVITQPKTPTLRYL